MNAMIKLLPAAAKQVRHLTPRQQLISIHHYSTLNKLRRGGEGTKQSHTVCTESSFRGKSIRAFPKLRKIEQKQKWMFSVATLSLS